MSTLSSLTSILASILEPKDHGDTKPSDDCSKSLGEALAKVDFSHTDLGSTDLGSQGPDHSDAHAALASMSSDDALDYAISQMGPADHLDVGHFDVGHFDVPGDTSHDT
jgi:hypothetical protein